MGMGLGLGLGWGWDRTGWGWEGRAGGSGACANQGLLCGPAPLPPLGREGGREGRRDTGSVPGLHINPQLDSTIQLHAKLKGERS